MRQSWGCAVAAALILCFPKHCFAERPAVDESIELDSAGAEEQHRGTTRGSPQLAPHEEPDAYSYHGQDIRNVRYVPKRFNVAVLIFVFIVSLMALVVYMNAKNPQGDEKDVEEAKLYMIKPCPLNEDFFSMTLCIYARNQQMLRRGSQNNMLHVMHILVSTGVMILILFVEVYFTYVVLCKLSAPAQEHIRAVYDHYQIVMYENHTVSFNASSSRYGGERQFHRGIPGHFNPSQFDTLSSKLQDDICQIPFSQPLFLVLLLTVWSFSVLVEVRDCFELFIRLVINTPTIDSMCSSLEEADCSALQSSSRNRRRRRRVRRPAAAAHAADEEEASEAEQQIDGPLEGEHAEQLDHQEVEREIPDLTLIGLTLFSKFFVCLIIILPRFIVSLALLEIGSIWMASTCHFENMVCNTVALAFIITLPYLVYIISAPEGAQIATQRTHVARVYPNYTYNVSPILGSFAWILWGLSWPLLFVFKLQQVLPMYGWDVRAVCDIFTQGLGVDTLDLD